MANRRESPKSAGARSWVASYWKVGAGTMLGGVKRSRSSHFASRVDAAARLASAIEINRGAGVEVAGQVVASSHFPEIFSHCAGTPAQAIGGHCFGCRKKLTVADARAHVAR